MSGKRLFAVFVFTVFAPGLLLTVFGARALWQEKRLTDRQLRDRLDRSAEASIRALGNEVARLQSMLDDGLTAEKAFRGLPADGSWAYAERHDAGVQVYPPNILPYELGAAPLAGAREPAGPEILHRRARALRDAGRQREAVQLWRQVESSGGRIGSVPADLVAGFELASLDDDAAKAFYRHLTEGRWRLEKPRYLYYSAEIRKRIGQHEEAGNLRLADALETAMSSGVRLFRIGGELYVAFRHDAPAGILVVSAGFLKTRVWPKVIETGDSDLRVAAISTNREVLYSLGRDASAPQAARTLDAGGLSWKVEVEPKDAVAFNAATDRRTSLYFALLLWVVVSLTSGGYFVARTVRRELEVARMKSEFVSTVSHEFRSPLTGIRQLGEMLARDRVTDESKRHQYYELIVRESERLARLVENVLDFSRMEAGGKQYRFEPVETTGWLTSVADEFQTEASRSGYLLQTDIPADLPAISGDREALSTALRNLLDNACKYSPESKSVWLDAEAANGGVRVRVRDRGIGIAAREQQQIFEKFYRGGALAKHVKGAGLGLSLVQHIVAAHHGDIQVESHEGDGSTFSMYLRAAS